MLLASESGKDQISQQVPPQTRRTNLRFAQEERSTHTDELSVEPSMVVLLALALTLAEMELRETVRSTSVAFALEKILLRDLEFLPPWGEGTGILEWN